MKKQTLYLGGSGQIQTIVSRECVTENVDPLCLTNRTINQELSMKQHGCRTKEGKECVAEVWKNVRGEWYQVRKELTHTASLS